MAENMLLSLLDADTNNLVRGFARINERSQGFTLDLAQTPVDQFSILAIAEMSESVKFEGTINADDGTTTKIYGVENIVPYAMFGDGPKEPGRFGRDVYGIDFVPGEYSFKVTAYEENRGKGSILDIEELNFTVIDSDAATVSSRAAGIANVRGTSGNDNLTGTNGNDTLIGVNVLEREVAGVHPRDVFLGRSEKDFLTGGGGADTFILGDPRQAFYDDGRRDYWHRRDYAVIQDFDHSEGDTIQLHGEASDYRLGASNPLGIDGGRAIYLKMSGPDELIGVVQGNSSHNLNLDSSQFDYAMSP